MTTIAAADGEVGKPGTNRNPEKPLDSRPAALAFSNNKAEEEFS